MHIVVLTHLCVDVCIRHVTHELKAIWPNTPSFYGTRSNESCHVVYNAFVCGCMDTYVVNPDLFMDTVPP